MPPGIQTLQGALSKAEGPYVGLDPGETTGLAVIQRGSLVVAEQINTKDVAFGAARIRDLLDNIRPVAVVMESYRIYSWRSKQHEWSILHTPMLIGAITYICHNLGLLLHMQTAQMAKGFCTDEKLKALGVYVTGQVHSRDAVRHVLYYVLFEVAKVHIRPEEGNGS